MKALGQLIKDYRATNDLSLREFAKKSNVSHSYIDKLEKGFDNRTGKKVEPTIDTIEKISKAMNVSLEFVLTQTGKISKYEKAGSISEQILKFIENEYGDINYNESLVKDLANVIENHLTETNNKKDSD
ncbi:helix-turn-helix domain-containing protein [Clostridium grantii]|uniref:Helix-turn-helix n=1 Tax=Clostridium grantii DSM 8605 TaxID=1121316 RepID=A0A1M5XWU8_9CLOT|nr:helix-turn-helix transcriptional regulator [Clostridium grantii]SHI04008.1 Helix-turn-helix [Clostridium grantii DSM 8605]